MPRVAEDVGTWAPHVPRAGEGRLALLGGGSQHSEAAHTAF